MKNYRFKTSKACEITRVDRNQLNEMIASGRYGCAPSTTKGTSRVFDMSETITLYIFGQMVRFGIPTPRAAEYATEIDWHVREIVNGDPEALKLRGNTGQIGIVAPVGTTGRGYVHVFENGRTIPKAIIGSRPAPDYPGAIIVLDIENIRDYITTMAEWEENNPILGDDD